MQETGARGRGDFQNQQDGDKDTSETFSEAGPALTPCSPPRKMASKAATQTCEHPDGGADGCMQADERRSYEQGYEEDPSGPGIVTAIHLADPNRDGSQELDNDRVTRWLWK